MATDFCGQACGQAVVLLLAAIEVMMKPNFQGNRSGLVGDIKSPAIG